LTFDAESGIELDQRGISRKRRQAKAPVGASANAGNTRRDNAMSDAGRRNSYS
jgi:hypothetical protein